MSAKRYMEEFKIEAFKQVTERGHAVVDVSARLGVSGHSLYQCVKQYKRVNKERDTLKKAAAYFAKESG